MSKPIRMSMPTRMNWLIDTAVFVGGLLAGLSGIYFLYLPSGGYEGGRNPLYGVTILFDRHTWSDVHAWAGLLVTAAIVIHFAIHWQWVKRMSRRTVNAMLARSRPLSKGSKVNAAVDLLIAISFLICAVSGIYFLFAPSGGFQGGNNPGFLFSRTTWDLIHTWSGVVLGVSAVVHFVIHWRWVKNVTVRFFLSLRPQPNASMPAPAGKATLGSSNQA